MSDFHVCKGWRSKWNYFLIECVLLILVLLSTWRALLLAYLCYADPLDCVSLGYGMVFLFPLLSPLLLGCLFASVVCVSVCGGYIRQLRGQRFNRCWDYSDETRNCALCKWENASCNEGTLDVGTTDAEGGWEKERLLWGNASER